MCYSYRVLSHEWQKQMSNCPLCRTFIKHMVGVKTLDHFMDKIYGSRDVMSESELMEIISEKLEKFEVIEKFENLKTKVVAIPIQPTKEWHISDLEFGEPLTQDQRTQPCRPTCPRLCP